MQFSIEQCSVMKCGTVQCSSIQYSDVPLAGVMMGSIERCISDVNGLLQMGEEVLLT